MMEVFMRQEVERSDAGFGISQSLPIKTDGGGVQLFNTSHPYRTNRQECIMLVRNIAHDIGSSSNYIFQVVHKCLPVKITQLVPDEPVGNTPHGEGGQLFQVTNEKRTVIQDIKIRRRIG